MESAETISAHARQATYKHIGHWLLDQPPEVIDEYTNDRYDFIINIIGDEHIASNDGYGNTK